MKLGDVVIEAKDGGTPPRKNPNNFGGDIYWCVVKDIQKEIFGTKEKLTQEGINNSSAKVWPVGSIIISLGATIGQVGIARVPTATKQGITGIVVDETKVIPEFLAYVLRNKKRTIQHMARGGTIKEVRPSRLLKELDINVPSIDQQRRIVAILDKADKIRVCSASVIFARAMFHSATFLDLFGDSTIEERYSRTTIDENSTTVSKGTTPMTHGMDFVKEGIPFLRVQDLVKNPIVPSFATKAINRATHDFLSRSQLKPNDILISIAGTIGRVSIVSKGSPDMNCNQAVAFVRLKETSVLRHKYLMHWLNSRDARLQMSGSSVTATISNLSLGKIKELKVPVPPLDLQIQFENICERFDMGSTYNGRVNNMTNSIIQEILG